MCTFLNVYDTQPLLPYLQRSLPHLRDRGQLHGQRHHSCGGADRTVHRAAGGIDRPQEGHRSVALRADGAHLLAATSQNLHQLIFWRFMQGIFVPGVIVVIMAYISEEFPRRLCRPRHGVLHHRNRAGRIRWAISSPAWWRIISTGATRSSSSESSTWRARSWCSAGCRVAKNFVRAEARAPLPHPTAGQHLRNPRLLAVFGMGFAALFCLVGTFTYANFYLAAPPYHLNSGATGQRLLRLPARTDRDAALGPLPRSLRDSHDLGDRLRLRRSRTAADTGCTRCR